MNAPDRAMVERLTILSNLGPVHRITQVTGGSNNRVFRVEAACGSAILKAYYRHPADTRDRLGAEFAFSRFARAAGIRSVPNALASDPVAGLGLFELVDGKRLAYATEYLVAEAIEFVRDLNAERWRPAAARLPLAAEACFSIEEHLGLVGGRSNRLGDIRPESEIDLEAVRFVRRELLPAWETVRSGTRALARSLGLSLDRPLDPLARCVSPSDFGFHNVVVSPDGRATFLDFEYAGWDDPAKLVCDFFCQPAVPVSEGYFDNFANRATEGFAEPRSALARCRLLMPVYRIKWVCIRLNEFLPVGFGRRQFAKNDELELRKHQQLEHARSALAAIVESERVSA